MAVLVGISQLATAFNAIWKTMTTGKHVLVSFLEKQNKTTKKDLKRCTGWASEMRTQQVKALPTKPNTLGLIPPALPDRRREPTPTASPLTSTGVCQCAPCTHTEKFQCKCRGERGLQVDRQTGRQSCRQFTKQSFESHLSLHIPGVKHCTLALFSGQDSHQPAQSIDLAKGNLF